MTDCPNCKYLSEIVIPAMKKRIHQLETERGIMNPKRVEKLLNDSTTIMERHAEMGLYGTAQYHRGKRDAAKEILDWSPEQDAPKTKE